MDDGERKRNFFISILGSNLIQNVIIGSVLLFCASMSLSAIYSASGRLNVSLAKTYDFPVNDEWYTISSTGEKVPVELPAEIECEGPSARIYRHVEVEDSKRDSFLIYSHHQNLRVFLDDVEIYSYEAPEGLPWLKSYRSLYHIVNLPAGTDGTLSIELTALIPKYAGHFPVVYEGDRLSLVFHVMRERPFKLFLGFAFIMLGIVLLVNVFFVRGLSNQNGSIMHLAMLSLFMGIWQIEESRVLQLFISNVGVHWFMEYPIQFIVLTGAFCFVRSIAPTNMRTGVIILFVTVFSAISVQLLLQISGKVPLSSSIEVTHVMLIGTIIIASLCINYKSKNDGDKAMLVVFNAAMVVSVFMLLFGTTNLIPWTDSETVMSLSLFFLFTSIAIILVRHSIKMGESVKKAGFYRNLAMVDFGTGVGSHTAWYTFTEEFCDSGRDEAFALMLFDINNLKKMNDTYGHQQGDMMIASFCSCLKEAVGERGKIYRIGGDEFICISEGCTELEAREMLDSFDDKIRQQGSNGIPFSAAYGYTIFTPHNKSDFYAAQKIADTRMYEMKRRMKSFSNWS